MERSYADDQMAYADGNRYRVRARPEAAGAGGATRLLRLLRMSVSKRLRIELFSLAERAAEGVTGRLFKIVR